MQNQDFIVISNRLPVTVTKQNGSLTFTASSGGLATAMSSVDADDEMLWIGWPGIPSDDLTLAEKRKIIRELKKRKCYPVFLTAKQVEEFYEGYSNETLWPVFHYFHSLANFNSVHWEAYKKVNDIFAKAVVKHASSHTTIWIHDYHFLLLPEKIRAFEPNCSIGFFLHIPFPSYEIFRLIPNRKELLQGLLGADLVGFHMYDYARHFAVSVQRTLGYKVSNGSIKLGKRLIKADAFPISIDYKKFKEAITTPKVQQEISMLDKHYKDVKIILSVDRLDYTKGISQRLEAFEQFLQKNPRYHKKVAMVMIAVPSRTEVDAYRDLRESIEQTISRINGTYASVDWTPVSYQFQNQPFDKLVALYAKADVALVTPLRDGMNLVAKEYVASKQQSNGVLILSELTGAVDELQEALIVNPNDTPAIVAALEQALRMPARQQKLRLNAMKRRVSYYDVQRWANDFLEELAATKLQQVEQNAKILNAEDKDTILASFAAAKKRLILLDYDGTLKSFVKSTSVAAAKPQKQARKMLRDLSNQANTDVYIMSGRPREALDHWFGSSNINLIAEHGYWKKQGKKWSNQDTNTAYKQLILPTLIKYTERTPGSTLEDKSSSLVWHYRNVAPELAYVRKRNLKHELGSILKDYEVTVHNGNKIIEIKPNNVNKGAMATEIIANSEYDFILCAGDDYTDEDMFKVLPDKSNIFTIKVGLTETNAQYQVQSVSDVIKLLTALT